MVRHELGSSEYNIRRSQCEEGVQALEFGEIATLHQLMADSHRSLRDDYEVSCREFDIMVELALQQSGVLGARMTGGGFGGCTVNLLQTAESDQFCERVAEGYQAAIGRRPDIYVCEASDGAGIAEPD